MDVGCAALDRVEQDLVDEAHDRRVLDVIPRDIVFFLFVANFEVFKIEIVVLEATHAGVDGLNRFVDAFLELILLDDDRIHPQAGRELDVVDRLQVGGVGNAKENALATFDEWQHSMFRDQFLVDCPNDLDILFDGIEVEERHAELVRGSHGDGARIGEVLAHEVSDQGDAFLLGAVGRLLEFFLGDNTVLDEAPRQARETGLCGRYRHVAPKLSR